MENPATTSERSKTALPRLYRWRFVLLGIYALCVICWYGGLMMDKNDRWSLEWWPPNFLVFAIATLILFGVQALFLLGAPHWRWPRPTGRRSMRVSLGVGTLLATLLTAGIAAALMSFFDVWESWGDALSDAGNNAGAVFFFVFIGVPWIFWLLVFTLIWSGNWMTKFRRLYRLLIAGTILELLITIPIDANVRKRTQCYCGEGSYFSLIIGLTMILWTFGPGLVMLFLARRMQRRATLGYCAECGYDLRRLPENRCPECGTPFQSIPAADPLLDRSSNRA